jgi:glutathione S-transferase
MIDLYYWTTPNGHKITIFLEEAAIAYRIVPVNISKGEQFKPEFLAISPNNRMPAIVDHDPNFLPRYSRIAPDSNTEIGLPHGSQVYSQELFDC